jgi:hypothetical protein
MLWRTVSRPVRLGVKHSFGAYDQIFITVLFFVGRPLCREDGSVFCICCWPSPAQSFSAPSPLALVTIFYCLRFETSLSSPPTTLRVTVEVFEPASTQVAAGVWVWVTLRLTVCQSVCLGIEPRPELMARYLLLFDNFCIVFGGGRPLWREGGSVFCQSLSAVISQLSVCTVIYI